MHPKAPIIRRQGEVNAWDNAEFREAVKKTGRKQIILAGIVTDVWPDNPSQVDDLTQSAVFRFALRSSPSL
ncbi:MAG TPA: hypothetical protein VGO47_11020 [Chlamydiales bacterium]|nr:hypothetical protein [Chlamydiales bacterium]